jgi:hypothetical protein
MWLIFNLQILGSSVPSLTLKINKLQMKKRRVFVDNVTLSDWPNVLAILLSPLFALQVGKLLDNLSNRKRRKEEIFNTLMETRAQTLSYEHVRALNKIDVAFYKCW